MIYTKDEEINLVKNHLSIFDRNLPKQIETRLITKCLRNSQHGLFFSLCNPNVYPYLLSAIEVIKCHKKSIYFPKLIKKLIKAENMIDQSAVVAEIITIAYYFKKFRDSNDITVVWERKLPNSTKTMDVSLLGLSKIVNIEVTAKNSDIRQRNHLDLRYKIKVAIEKAIEIYQDKKYSYIFSLYSEDKNGSTITYFTEHNINDFVNYILSVRKNGEGLYNFISNGKSIASVKITNLNKLKVEYAANLDIWTGFLNDEKRICGRIVEKAEAQLPKNDVNFVYIPNFGGFDEIDYQEAFLGKEQWHISIKSGNIIGVDRQPNGAIHIINENNYSPISGLIWSGFNYSKKNLLLNPLTETDEKYINLID